MTVFVIFANILFYLSVKSYRSRDCDAYRWHQCCQWGNGDFGTSPFLGNSRTTHSSESVGVQVRRAVHPGLLRLRLSVHGGRMGIGDEREGSAGENERGDNSLRGLGKHDKISFCCNNGRVIPSSAVGYVVHPRKIQREAAHTSEDSRR